MTGPVILCDAHVHVYPGFDAELLLDSAHSNFNAVAKRVGASRWKGVLLLTETRGVDWFSSALAPPRGGDKWQFAPSRSETIGLEARRGEAALLIISGRQIATAERLEVHAFGTRTVFEDGQDLQTSVDAVQAAGAWAALPWGVGKWSGSRGGLVTRLLRDPRYSGVLTADNGGRPWFWPEGRLKVDSRRAILRGSDPLPIAQQETRVGESGVWLEGELELAAPATALLRRIWCAPPREVHSFGPREGLVRFLRNQLMLRLDKRRLGMAPRGE